jgi:hypothetical protein
MMEFVLVVSACMISDPKVCKDYKVNIYDENVKTQMQCLSLSQPEMVKLIQEHPGWRITKWKCEDASRYLKKGKSI